VGIVALPRPAASIGSEPLCLAAPSRHDRAMSDLPVHAGGCHCGKVRYQVALDLSRPVIVCNCSICKKTGTMLAFAPAEQLTLESGEEELIDYQFNKKIIHHYFCRTCGVRSFARGMTGDKPMAAVNVRCLDDVELEDLSIMQHDGAST
jgi:hypothetical protein